MLLIPLPRGAKLFDNHQLNRMIQVNSLPKYLIIICLIWFFQTKLTFIVFGISFYLNSIARNVIT